MLAKQEMRGEGVRFDALTPNLQNLWPHPAVVKQRAGVEGKGGGKGTGAKQTAAIMGEVVLMADPCKLICMKKRRGLEDREHVDEGI